MGYVEEEIGPGGSEEFEAAGPAGVANSFFNLAFVIFVTVIGYLLCYDCNGGVAEFVGGGYCQGYVALLVVAGERGVDLEGFAGEGEGVVVAEERMGDLVEKRFLVLLRFRSVRSK